LFEVENIQALANELGVAVLAKVIFSFTPDIVLSPLALPRKLLNDRVDILMERLPEGALKDVLLQLKQRPTFQEQWPDQWQSGLAKGKARILQLEKIRKDQFTMGHILEKDTELKEWWDNVSVN
jgi:hypothetical protein